MHEEIELMMINNKKDLQNFKKQHMFLNKKKNDNKKNCNKSNKIKLQIIKI